MKMMMPIHINSRAGLNIYDYLKEALSLPDNCVEITVVIKHNDLISVTCKYYPGAKTNEPVVKTLDMFPTEQS